MSQRICINHFPTYSKSAAGDLGIVFSKIWKILGGKNENIVAKGEIARFEQFLLLSKWFQKSSAADALTYVYRWEGLLLRCPRGSAVSGINIFPTYSKSAAGDFEIVF